jgi:acyl-CoA thioesterase FadM
MPSLLLMKEKSPPAIHCHEITISKAVIDANGHTNNVEYLRWMQDAAISHASLERLWRSESRKIRLARSSWR